MSEGPSKDLEEALQRIRATAKIGNEKNLRVLREYLSKKINCLNLTTLINRAKLNGTKTIKISFDTKFINTYFPTLDYIAMETTSSKDIILIIEEIVKFIIGDGKTITAVLHDKEKTDLTISW